MKYIIDLPEEFAEATKEYWEKTVGMQLEPYEEPEDECSTGWELYNAYQKAKEKYETWKKQKDKIKIGEEYHNGLKWTSVKTTPPPSEENVLVSCVDYSGDTPFKYTDVGWITPDHKNWIVGNKVNWNVIAWAPLPEPYEKNNESEI